MAKAKKIKVEEVKLSASQIEEKFNSLIAYFNIDCHGRQRVPELEALRDEVLKK